MNVFQLSAKDTMNHLLLKETFDSFSFIEGEITTFNRFAIDGFLRREFFDEPPAYSYSHWKDVRGYCLELIRGKRTPLEFKIVLSLAPECFPAFLSQYQITSFRPEEIQGLYLNFQYDGSALQCVTGISLHSFSLDKSLERQWDEYVEEFLKSWKI
ncbi:hypothetical protein FND36_04255 [Lachnospiraceae bacterium KGMB03038]|nr:hypothetical protein FND36_04255 [Lachnospiraceae bacterium KGMB03038]